jgi:hypothetical protein
MARAANEDNKNEEFIYFAQTLSKKTKKKKRSNMNTKPKRD